MNVCLKRAANFTASVLLSTIVCTLVVADAFVAHASVPPKLTLNRARKQGDWIHTTKQVKRGDTIYSLLKGHYFNEQQIQKILRQSVFPKKFTLAPGSLFRVKQNKKISRLELKVYDPSRDISYTFVRNRKEADSFRAKEDFRVKVHSIKGKIKGSVLASVNKHVDSNWLSYRFIDAYVLDYNLKKELRRGAPFSMTFEAKYDGDQFIKYGEILQTSLKIKNKLDKRTFVPFEDGGTFVSSNVSHKDRPLYSPVDYLHFSSLYQRRRFHPIKKRYQAHLGVDFVLPEGEKIYSSYAGRVLRSGKNRGAGRFVVIKHPNGLETYYNHMSAIADGIRPGKYVTSGELIGFIGCTGYCTKPHLHFAVKRRGRYLDPIKYLKSYPFRKKALIEKNLAFLQKKSAAKKLN